jgi:hypothetical protein
MGVDRLKRFFSLVLCAFLLFSVLPVSAAAQCDLSGSLSAADKLNSLGLFNGTGTDTSGNPIYELERKPTRAEAIVMLIRTLGRTARPARGTITIPFTDVPSWATVMWVMLMKMVGKRSFRNPVGAGNTARAIPI